MGDIVNLHDHTKLCCGPFCAECETAMVKQDEEVARLKARIARLQAEVTATRWRDEVCRCHRGGCAGCDKRISDARAAVDQHKDLEPPCQQ